MKLPDFLFNNFNLTLGKFSIPVPIFQAIIVVFLLFVLVLTFAHMRRHLIDWSFKGAVFGIFIGFFLAIILEGFLLVYGKTAVTGLLGWKNAPKPISVALDAGRSKLVSVLGLQTESVLVEGKEENIIQSIQSLNPDELKKLKSIICN